MTKFFILIMLLTFVNACSHNKTSVERNIQSKEINNLEECVNLMNKLYPGVITKDANSTNIVFECKKKWPSNSLDHIKISEMKRNNKIMYTINFISKNGQNISYIMPESNNSMFACFPGEKYNKPTLTLAYEAVANDTSDYYDGYSINISPKGSQGYYMSITTSQKKISKTNSFTCE